MMIVLIVLVILSLAGIGFVLWLLKNDSESADESVSDDEKPIRPQPKVDENVQNDSEEGPPSPDKLNLQPDLMVKLASIKEKTLKPKDKSSKPKSKSLFTSALNKMKRGKPNPDEEVPTVNPLPDLKELHNSKIEESVTETEPPQEQTVSPEPEEPTAQNQPEPTEEIHLPEADEKEIEQEIELTAELSELKEKYEKLDSMFNEKSAEFEKMKESLDHEMKNRKEFNKVKDILEKELKDSKEKAREAQAQLNNTQSEIESQKKRNLQLDEKASKLEKDLLKKEDEVVELKQKAQAPVNPALAENSPESGEQKLSNDPAPQPAPMDQTQSGEPVAENQTEPPPAEKSEQNKVSNNDAPDQQPKPEELPKQEESETPTENKPPQQAESEVPKPENGTNQEGGEPKEEDKPKPSAEQPEQTGGFTLDLSIDKDVKPESESQPNPPEDSTDNPKPN